MVDEGYLTAIRLLPCCVCGRSGPSDAAHIRMSDAAWGGLYDKPYTGGAEKPDDCWSVPLCRPVHKPDSVARILKPDKPVKLVDVGCHGRQHGADKKTLDVLILKARQNGLTDGAIKLEEAFWRATGKNPFMIAATLYSRLGTGLKPKAKKRKPRTTIKPRGFAAGKRKIPNRPFPTTKRKLRT
jgi:hypothetical protein